MLDFRTEIEQGLNGSLQRQETRRLLAEIIQEAVGAAVAKANSDPDQLVDVEEAAKRLGMTRGAVFKAVERGKLPAKRIGRRIRFRLGDLTELAR